MKVRLLKHLSAGSKSPGPLGTVAAAQCPPQAHQFISLLLEEYNALCQAARTISSFLLTLVSLSTCLSVLSHCLSVVTKLKRFKFPLLLLFHLPAGE